MSCCTASHVVRALQVHAACEWIIPSQPEQFFTLTVTIWPNAQCRPTLQRGKTRGLSRKPRSYCTLIGVPQMHRLITAAAVLDAGLEPIQVSAESGIVHCMSSMQALPHAGAGWQATCMFAGSTFPAGLQPACCNAFDSLLPVLPAHEVPSARLAELDSLVPLGGDAGQARAAGGAARA